MYIILVKEDGKNSWRVIRNTNGIEDADGLPGFKNRAAALEVMRETICPGEAGKYRLAQVIDLKISVEIKEPETE